MSIGRYGAAALANPAIVLLDRGARTACIALQDATNATVADLQLAGGAYGVLLNYTATSGLGGRGVLVQRVLFRDISGPDQGYAPSDGGNPGGGAAVAFAAPAGANVTVADVAIVHNLGLRIDSFFTQRAVHAPGRVALSNLTVANNTVSKCWYNCMSLVAGSDLLIAGNVFLRDTSARLAVYGVTDLIIGSLDGGSRAAIRDNCFIGRQVYAGEADGCNIDFETGATQVVVANNTFFRPWGAGVLVYGHGTNTSHDLTLAGNAFLECGCATNRADRGGVALTGCPPGNLPSLTATDNTFALCPGGIGPGAYTGCADNVTHVRDRVLSNMSTAFCSLPQLVVGAAPPGGAHYLPVRATCSTANATLRYTTDGR